MNPGSAVQPRMPRMGAANAGLLPAGDVRGATEGGVLVQEGMCS